ncbi:MAG: hypothetical protein OIF35_05270, partial [Cellvibrionaceae bacterium]|nr:hypothetical protein [Cellvibrionaceae bacterium]
NKPKPGGPKLSPHIKPLKLDRHELAALESFLHSISRRPGYVRPPNLPKAAAPIITQATKKL